MTRWTPEARAAAAERMRRQWANPDFARRQAAAMADPDVRARISASNKATRAARRDFEIPAWVEAAGLAELFGHITRQKGEEAAAGVCREVKRMMKTAADALSRRPEAGGGAGMSALLKLAPDGREIGASGYRPRRAFSGGGA